MARPLNVQYVYPPPIPACSHITAPIPTTPPTLSYPYLTFAPHCLRNAFFAHLDLLLILHIDTFTLFIHDFTMYMLDDYVYLLYYLLDIITHYVIGTSILWPAYLSDNTCTLVYGKIPFVLYMWQ